MNTSLKKVAVTLLGLFFLTSLSYPVYAQSQQFETGLEFYQNGDYEQAAAAFNTMRDSRAYLFAGKSYYAMGRYQQAQANLNNVAPDAPPAIYQEAIYTSALIDFQLKQFGDALSKLHQMMSNDVHVSLRLDAKQLYRQIQNYLTAGQRITILPELSAGQIKFDLLKFAMGKASYSQAVELYNVFEANTDGEWRNKAEEISSHLSSEANYNDAYGSLNSQLRPPEGTIYNLGIALPEYQPDATEFSIVKSLYQGAFIAAQDFNEEQDNAKVALHFIDSGTANDLLESSIEQFAENHQGDALIGPLFSEQAEPLIPHVNEFKIPTIAPLANSYINSTGSYLFQANPTFAIHGREMARYAVNELNLQRFAIIARRGSAGASSAEAFRDEAEKLGAQIEYYFVEDLHSNAYEISQYTQYFGSQEQPIDAVYAPLTGNASLTVIDLLLADLRIMPTPPIVLGSQEWQRLDYSSSKYDRLHIYFSQGYYSDDRGMRMVRFRNTYQQAFNTDPNQYSMIGYDVAKFLLSNLDNVGNPALLKSSMLEHPLYRGLINDILFDGGNVNEALQILEIKEGKLRLVR